MISNKFKLCKTTFIIGTLLISLLIFNHFYDKKSKKLTNEDYFISTGYLANANDSYKMSGFYIHESLVEERKNERMVTKLAESIHRGDFVNLINKNLKTLEIGPYVNPSIRGENVKYFDILNKEQIEESANKRGLKINLVPDIDFVEPSGDLSIVNEKFKNVFSAHNIEHQIDLISHFKQAENLMDEGAKYYMVIPDKRYCFDHFVDESNLNDVLSAFYNNNKKVHTLKTMLSNCIATHNDPKRHWAGDHGNINPENYIKCALDKIKSYSTTKYRNSHNWRFTPESFLHLMNSIYKMGFINLKVKEIHQTAMNNFGFCVVLEKR